MSKSYARIFFVTSEDSFQPKLTGRSVALALYILAVLMRWAIVLRYWSFRRTRS